MSEKPNPDLAPETANPEQEDEGAQAQSIADEAAGRSTDDFGLDDTEKGPGEIEGDEGQDLVDHMRQMESSGTIDMSAFRGERNDDDEEGMYGESAEED